MLNGPLLGKIVAFAIPLAVAYIVQSLFITIDSLILGTFVSDEALAAIGDASPIASLVLGLVTGLSIGSNVDVAVHIGRNELAEVSRSVESTLPIALVSGLILGVAGIASCSALLTLIGTPASVLPLASDYLFCYFGGMPAIALYNFASAVLRANGDSKSPMIALAIGCVINVGLDFVFSVWLDLKTAGVALATDIAMLVAALILVGVLARTTSIVHLDLAKLGFSRSSVSTVLRIGLPAGIQSAIFAVSNIVLQDAINGFGSSAIAGSMASLNYEYFCYYMVTAFAQTCVTFVGQNFAAHKYDRCRRAFALCMVLGASSSAVVSMLTLTFAQPLLSVFSSSPDVITYGLQRVRIVAALDFLAFLYEVPSGAMRGMGHSLTPAVIIILGSCGLRVLWVLTAFRSIGTFEGLMAIYPISWIATGIAMLCAYAWITHAVLGRSRPSVAASSRA
jgi:putative MATE family efflux protein